jgi:hypothetical protein
MAVLYTVRDIEKALLQLRIKPDSGKVNTEEAARILSWRAKEEQGIVHRYNGSAVRRHVINKTIVPHPKNTRYNLYLVEDIFALPLVPRRGPKQQIESEMSK